MSSQAEELEEGNGATYTPAMATTATDERRTVSANEAARIKGCSIKAVITGTRSGALKSERGPGGKYGTLLIPRAALDAWEPNGIGRPKAGSSRRPRPRARARKHGKAPGRRR